ncbi:uncharacterized protein LOC132194264 [Neocloeon triangulifer]|uniref:uncharacterized protein LOC132194264 n=1 Tax=Neocloeon triangulifer TaxID=2078957 RepID=UPI00286F5C0B|nr:uncharacterized protein LOC132194264 [Neocloeon triangulifer]
MLLRPVVLLVLLGVLHQVARGAPPNTKSRSIVFISPSWPMFFPMMEMPQAELGPQSRSPDAQTNTLGSPQPQPMQTFIPVSIFVYDPSRQVASTIQGYVTQAVGFLTNRVTSAVSGVLPQLPVTINIPDIFNGVANRVTAVSTAVQTAWQNRPANNPTAVDPLPDRLPNPDDELII